MFVGRQYIVEQLKLVLNVNTVYLYIHHKIPATEDSCYNKEEKLWADVSASVRDEGRRRPISLPTTEAMVIWRPLMATLSAQTSAMWLSSTSIGTLSVLPSVSTGYCRRGFNRNKVKISFGGGSRPIDTLSSVVLGTCLLPLNNSNIRQPSIAVDNYLCPVQVLTLMLNLPHHTHKLSQRLLRRHFRGLPPAAAHCRGKNPVAYRYIHLKTRVSGRYKTGGRKTKGLVVSNLFKVPPKSAVQIQRTWTRPCKEYGKLAAGSPGTGAVLLIGAVRNSHCCPHPRRERYLPRACAHKHTSHSSFWQVPGHTHHSIISFIEHVVALRVAQLLRRHHLREHVQGHITLRSQRVRPLKIHPAHRTLTRYDI